jgi:transposase
MVKEHRGEYRSEWAAIESISVKLGIGSEVLRRWVRRDEIDTGQRPGLTTAEREQIEALRRENRDLRRANEILKEAAVFFARELDPRRPTP